MEIIPAIDIRGGKCVRLYQGDYERETIFSESPLDEARRWAGLGASWIHVVDLDGARSGIPTNLDLVGKIASTVNSKIQYGGGIRTLEVAEKAVSLGVDRVVIGTAAAKGSDLLKEVCSNISGDSVTVSIDARDGYVVQDGWTRVTEISSLQLLHVIEQTGLKRFVYTDVSRDGTLTEPNFRTIEELMSASNLEMFVAGGISSLDHLLKLSALGVKGAIVGKAIYTGALDLRHAIDLMRC